jgi:hypothetical protein
MKHDKEIEDKENKKAKKSKKEKGDKRESWFKGYGEATKAELEGRIGSSVKRLIKFIGLAIIPIIYAVVCILAFWNPIENIGKANVTFIDQEGEVLLATHKKLGDDFDNYIVYSAPTAEVKAETDIHDYDFVSALLESSTDETGAVTYVQKHDYSLKDKDALNKRLVAWKALDHDNGKEEGEFAISTNISDDGAVGLDDISKIEKLGGIPSIDKTTINYVYCISGFNFLVASGILKSNDAGNDLEAKTFYTDALTEQKIVFSNVHYQEWENKGQDTWHSYKSYIQAKVSEKYFRSTLDLINYYYYIIQFIADEIAGGNMNEMQILFLLQNVFKSMNQLQRLEKNNVQIWTTFARNFIFGYYMNTINEFKQAIPVQLLEKTLGEFEANAPDEIKEIIEMINGTDIAQLLGPDSKAITVDIEGVENGIYGIGLGEFFLLIGLYVGTLMHTFVYDRAKRGGAKVKHSQWYLAKLTTMALTGAIQVTLLTLVLLPCGWYQLGVARMFELWGALLLIDFTFKVTIQAIWFSVKDETIGKFLCVIYMVINLSSGWGTFPSFMQFGFFNAISHVAEYTYALHIIGIVCYGGNYGGDWAYALQNVGYLLVFIAVLFTFGFFMSILRNREMHYGTYRKRHLLEGFEALGHTDLKDDFVAHGWKGIPNDVVMDDMVQYMRVHHPFEKQFKRYKNKNHPRPIKPNYTDDDIMTRNDDVLA